MNQKEKEEIYTVWKSLREKCGILAGVTLASGISDYKIKDCSVERRLDFIKYTQWVLSYAEDLLTREEGGSADFDGVAKIICQCNESHCAKCLLVNCKDDNCYYHPKNKKDIFSRNYKNRK